MGRIDSFQEAETQQKAEGSESKISNAPASFYGASSV
jgi:hypothetical protein